MTMPTPFMILRARIEARAILYRACEYQSLREATAPLVEFAHESGLVGLLGIDGVRSLIAQGFDLDTNSNKDAAAA